MLKQEAIKPANAKAKDHQVTVRATGQSASLESKSIDPKS